MMLGARWGGLGRLGFEVRSVRVSGVWEVGMK